MKNTLRVLLILGILLFFNTHSVLADSATFSAFSEITISIREPLPEGLTVTVEGAAATPTPVPMMQGSGMVTMFPRASQSLPSDPISVRLTFHTIAGQAGPSFGLASVTQTASSSLLNFVNSTNHEIVITFDYNYHTELRTTLIGMGTAQARFEFSITRDGMSPFTRVFSTQGNNPAFVDSGGDPLSFTIPAHGSGAIGIRGSQSGLAEVPEPTTMLLLGTGLAGVVIKVRKRLKSPKSG